MSGVQTCALPILVTLVIIGWVIVGVYWGSKRTEMDDLLGFSQDGYGENWAR